MYRDNTIDNSIDQVESQIVVRKRSPNKKFYPLRIKQRTYQSEVPNIDLSPQRVLKLVNVIKIILKKRYTETLLALIS